MTLEAAQPGIDTTPVGAPGVAQATSATSSDETKPGSQPVTFPIVGVGASAGGLKALGQLFDEIPIGIGMAFVVVQHLDPNHASQLATLLAKKSRLPIVEAVEGGEIKPNHVYVNTPNTRTRIEKGVFRVTPRAEAPQPHLTIDAFLKSLAIDRPGSAIAVILSGTGSDGTLGLTAIKAAGGVSFAQDDTAEYAGMPLSAIGHGHVDFVLSPAEIAHELGKIAEFGFPAIPQTPPAIQPSEDEESEAPGPTPEDREPYATIIRLLHTATGIDFTHYRSTTIMRRTSRRMAMASLTTLADYARHAAEVPGEIDALAKDILINVTSFFRDKAVFEALKTTVFPTWENHRGADATIRLWIVGCSTGQEVYSLAIELAEQFRSANVSPRMQIFATDISDWALAKARIGCYSDNISEEMSPDRLARYFVKEPTGYRIVKSIRELCVFAKHDVTADTPFSRIDLISCRNVLIYLGPVLQKHVLPTFHFALKPGAFLVLGTSETIGKAANLFETIDEKYRIYRAKATARKLVRAPVSNLHSNGQSMPLPALPIIPSASEMQHAADQIVLGRFAPAGVLITENMEIIQFRGRTTPYLEPAQGEASLNLLTMVPFGVADVLRQAVSEAKEKTISIRRDRIAHTREHHFREIAIEVIPIKLPTTVTSYLILFEEQTGTQSPPATPPLSVAQSPTTANDGAAALGRPNQRPQEDQREVNQLRLELAAATDYVRSLVGMNLAQAEQLKEALEEAQSSSEEFRSTNEELQTTKEEIESTNEELVTINEELRSTNADVAKVSAALRASGEFTAAIVETMRYPLLVLNASLSVESANQAFLDAFGVERQKTIGRLVYDLGNGQWNIPELRRLLEDILPNNSAFDDFEVTHEFRTIGRRTMLLNARRLQGQDEQSRLIVLVIADITERARITKELKDMTDELQRSNAELDQFAAVASHDLQEPLRMMSSYISLLETRYEPLFDARAREYMAHVTDGARRLREMIAGILSYSQIEYEPPSSNAVDSSIALKHAVTNLTVKIANAEANIIEGVLPRVVANPEQLTQLFQNLMSNGLKFRSDQRPPVIRVNAREAENEWVFSVADNGIGIETDNFSRIFQIFQRVNPSSKVKGCGIGLATCKKIIEHHKGRIWVESVVDVGSTFFFSLPK